LDCDLISIITEPITGDSKGTLKKLDDLKIYTLKKISPFLHFIICLTDAISFVINII